VPAARRGRGVEQQRRAIEPARRDPRDRGRLVGRQLGRLGHDRLAHSPLREPPERDRLATRANRLRQRADLVGHEHDHGVGGRLLEVLQQRVRRLFVHRVRAEDQIDAAVGLERPHVQVVAELADRVDPDLVPEGLEHIEIWM